MNLFVLQYFVAVCDAQSIARAAEQLSLSRQALSKAILVLEDELGVTLLRRKKSGIERTQAGDVLYRRAVALLGAWDDTLGELEAVKRAQRAVLRVGYGQMTYNLWETGHVEAFARAHPNIEVSCEVMLPDQLLQGLTDGRLDLIVSSAHEDERRFSSTLIQRLPLHVILNGNDPLARREEVHIEDLARHTIFLGVGHSNFADWAMRVFQAEGIAPEFRTSPSSDPLTILRSVRDSGGAYFTSTLHTFYHGALDGLAAVPFVYRGRFQFPTRDIYATALRENAGSFAVQQYVRFLLAEKDRAARQTGGRVN